ncbi:MAG: hypothetical protein LBR08_07065, partial [Bacteroidales bacterium]|nr:hypothetical protein [Bacteroidales bacterium]
MKNLSNQFLFRMIRRFFGSALVVLFPYGFVSGSGLQPENDVSHVLRQGVAITGTVTDENGS